jgi:hypothetical protein
MEVITVSISSLFQFGIFFHYQFLYMVANFVKLPPLLTVSIGIVTFREKVIGFKIFIPF